MRTRLIIPSAASPWKVSTWDIAICILHGSLHWIDSSILQHYFDLKRLRHGLPAESAALSLPSPCWCFCYARPCVWSFWFQQAYWSVSRWSELSEASIARWLWSLATSDLCNWQVSFERALWTAILFGARISMDNRGWYFSARHRTWRSVTCGLSSEAFYQKFWVSIYQPHSFQWWALAGHPVIIQAFASNSEHSNRSTLYWHCSSRESSWSGWSLSWFWSWIVRYFH